jgi:hypothetical protein
MHRIRLETITEGACELPRSFFGWPSEVLARAIPLRCRSRVKLEDMKEPSPGHTYPGHICFGRTDKANVDMIIGG